MVRLFLYTDKKTGEAVRVAHQNIIQARKHAHFNNLLLLKEI